MKNNLLYYPYINIPQSSWTVKSILYWDSVGIIVPPQHLSKPNRYKKTNRALLIAGLLDEVVPINYTSRLPNFDGGFIELVEQNSNQVDRGRNSFDRGRRTIIYTPKFGRELLNYLVDLQLAREINYEQYEVETTVANKIMLYLATCIGQVGDFTPGTDNISHLPGGYFRYKANIRQNLLDELIPYPKDPDPYQLRKFKDLYYEELRSFRILLEQVALDISLVKNTEARNDKLELKIAEILDKKEKISRELNQANFGKIFFGSICGIVGGIIGFAAGNPVAGSFSLANAVYSALDGYDKQGVLDRDYSYLALIDRKFT